MMYWGNGNEIHPPTPLGRVNTERISLDGKTKVIVTKWQWWKLTFEGTVTECDGPMGVGFFSKRWIKTGFVKL